MSSYRVTHHAPGPDGGSPMFDVEPSMPDYYAHPEWYGTVGGAGAKMVRLLMRVRGKPDAKVTVYRAVPPGVRTVNAGDWVTPLAEYAKRHAVDLLGPGKHGIVLAREARACELFTNGDSAEEWGWWPEAKR